jgi:hypothetical protein
MNVHENVIVDLLAMVRSGQASAETRELVDAYLVEHPQLQKFAGLGAPPDAALEIQALEKIRMNLRRASWEKGFALMFSILPFSFVFDGTGLRFLFADHPGLIVGMVVTALAFWARYYRFSRRFC